MMTQENHVSISDPTVPLSFALPPALTIETAEAVADELRKIPITERSTVVLDASHVEQITTPGLQLIVSLEKTLLSRGGTLIIEGKTDSLTRTFSDAGLEGLLIKSS